MLQQKNVVFVYYRNKNKVVSPTFAKNRRTRRFDDENRCPSGRWTAVRGARRPGEIDLRRRRAMLPANLNPLQNDRDPLPHADAHRA